MRANNYREYWEVRIMCIECFLKSGYDYSNSIKSDSFINVVNSFSKKVWDIVGGYFRKNRKELEKLDEFIPDIKKAIYKIIFAKKRFDDYVDEQEIRNIIHMVIKLYVGVDYEYFSSVVSFLGLEITQGTLDNEE